MSRIKKISVLYMLSIILLLSCEQSSNRIIEKPKIVFGTAKLTGKILIPDGATRDSVFVRIAVPHPISGEFVKYSGIVDQSGSFSIDADVETNISFVHFSTSFNPRKPLLIILESGKVKHIDVFYNSNFDIEKIVTKPTINENDMSRYHDLIGKMIQYPMDKPEPLYNKSTDQFLNYSRSLLSKIMSVVRTDKLMSKEYKSTLYDDFRLFFYKGFIFDYANAMRANYATSDRDGKDKLVINPVDRSYYSFLKDLSLNDPKYLSVPTFLEFQRKLLENEILAITPIAETDIPTWLASVKVILADLVGFKDGQYYDILAANSYGRQLTEEVTPLSEKQKENIRNYWKEGEIAKILFRKNEAVAELDNFKPALVVNDISSTADDKVMETIVAKHKGKVVFIDLWATWCGPCLEAMKEFRSTKSEFHSKDVAFVYLTNGSSPRKLWEEKIKGIGSEHYYLKDSQWEHIMNQFEFEYIPSYLLFNKEGVLIKKYTAFPGKNVIEDAINGLL